MTFNNETKKNKPEVVFWSSTQKKSFPFANQKQFKNCIWKNFNKGEKVFDESGNIAGVIKKITESKNWLTDLK